MALNYRHLRLLHPPYITTTAHLPTVNIRSKLLPKQDIRLYPIVEHIQLWLLSFSLLCFSSFYACPTNTALHKLSNSLQGSCKVRGPWTGWTYLPVHYSLNVHVELQQTAPSNITTHFQCNMPIWLQEHTKFQQQKTNQPYEAQKEQKLGLIKHTQMLAADSTLSDWQIVKTMYFAYVHSSLKYGNLFLGNYWYLKTIFTLKKEAIMLIACCINLHSMLYLCQQLISF